MRCGWQCWTLWALLLQGLPSAEAQGHHGPPAGTQGVPISDLDTSGALVPAAIGALFTVIGTALFVWLHNLEKLEARLKKEGVDTGAIVQSKEYWDNQNSGPGSGGGRSWALHLIFDADRSTDGVRCRITHRKLTLDLQEYYAQGIYDRLNAGQTVTVKYLPSNPRLFKIADDSIPEKPSQARVGMFIGGAFILFGAGAGIGIPVGSGQYVALAAYPGVYGGVLLLGYAAVSQINKRLEEKNISVDENPTGSIPTPGAAVVQGAVVPETA